MSCLPIDNKEELLGLVSRLLSNITQQLACVLYPKLDTGILERLQIISVSSSRILIVLSISSGMIKTITLEINAGIKESQIQEVQTILNERLGGLSLKEIRTTFTERMKDFSTDLHPVLTVFLESIDKIFKDANPAEKAIITGATNLLRKPEFDNPDSFQGVIEMIEDKDVIFHVFEKATKGNQSAVSVTIGAENEIPQLGGFSLVAKEYQFGEITGTLGVIGPKRMEYAKIMAIVNYVSDILTETLTKQ